MQSICQGFALQGRRIPPWTKYRDSRSSYQVSFYHVPLSCPLMILLCFRQGWTESVAFLLIQQDFWHSICVPEEGITIGTVSNFILTPPPLFYSWTQSRVHFLQIYLNNFISYVISLYHFSINNKLHQPEASHGVLQYAMKNYRAELVCIKKKNMFVLGCKCGSFFW